MGVASQPVQNYFDDEPFAIPQVQSETYNAPSFAIPLYDPYREQLKARAQELDTQNMASKLDIAGGDNNWGSPEGRAKLQDYIARGIVQPQQARAMMATIPKTGAPNRYSEVPLEVAHAVSRINQIDPSDPEAMQQLHGLLNTDQIPVDVQTHPQFSSSFKELKKEILSQRQQAALAGRHDPNDAMINDALKNGVTPDELAPYLDETGAKVTNPIGLRRATYQAKTNQIAAPAASLKNLSELQMRAFKHLRDEPTDQDKSIWLQSKGIDPANATQEQWQQAWYGAKYGPAQEYQNAYDLLAAQGYKRLPKKIGGMAPQAPAQQQAPSFNSVEEANNAGLPSGTIVLIGGRRARIN